MGVEFDAETQKEIMLLRLNGLRSLLDAIQSCMIGVEKYDARMSNPLSQNSRTAGIFTKKLPPMMNCPYWAFHKVLSVMKNP
jgi:hypothetical protein